MNKNIITVAAVAAITTVAFGATSTFDDLGLGSINTQGGWTVQDSWGTSVGTFDQAVVLEPSTTNKVWRLSSAVTSSGYSLQPFSPSAPQIAGETGAELFNDYGPNHTSPFSPPLSSGTAATPFFYGGWDVKSATGTAQPGMGVTVSASGKQSTLRMSYLRMEDNGSTGINLLYIGTGAGGSFPSATIIDTLSYTAWHRIEMFHEFVDGEGPGVTGNDIVTVKVDGVVKHVGTTWESYYASFVDGGIPVTSERAVDSLLFRVSGTAALATSGAGFFFDNVEVSNAAIPEPASLGLLGLAGMLIGRRRRV